MPLLASLGLTALVLWPVAAVWLASRDQEPRTSYDHGTFNMLHDPNPEIPITGAKS